MRDYGPDGYERLRTRRLCETTDQTVMRDYGPDGYARLRTRQLCETTDQTVMRVNNKKSTNICCVKCGLSRLYVTVSSYYVFAITPTYRSYDILTNHNAMLNLAQRL